MKNYLFDSITNNAPNAMSVVWELTSTCNYSCWYCLPHLHDNKYKWPDLQASLDFFYMLSQKHSRIHVDLAGGEPTLWPELPTFLKQKPDNIYTNVASNGSRTVKWWSRNIEYMDSVLLSFHPDTADIDHFYNVCKAISNRDLYPKKDINVSILVYKQLLDKCNEAFNRLKELPISCKMKIIDYRFKPGMHVTPTDLDIIEEINEKRFNNYSFSPEDGMPSEVYLDGKKIENKDFAILKFFGKTDFKGWKCNAGITRLFIVANGDIFRGTCRNGGRIGNIMFDTNVFNLEPTVCHKIACSCLDEVILEKHRISPTSPTG